LELKVVLSKQALKDLKKIALADLKIAKVIRSHLEQIPNTYTIDTQLKGPAFKGIRRHRVGNYRIIYRVEHEQLIILVIRIGHRKDIYDL